MQIGSLLENESVEKLWSWRESKNIKTDAQPCFIGSINEIKKQAQEIGVAEVSMTQQTRSTQTPKE